MGAYFKGKFIEREDMLRSMREFDGRFPNTNDYAGWLDNAAYKYAIRHAGRIYPPKLILSTASGYDTATFNGGSQTNSVFEKLGFDAIDKP